jgi:hypothetical protein
MDAAVSTPIDVNTTSSQPTIHDSPTPNDQPPKKSGRPFALDDAKRGEICALVTAGCSIEWAASRRIRSAANRAEIPISATGSARPRSMPSSSPSPRCGRPPTSHWRAAAWMLDRQRPSRPGRRRYLMAMRRMGQILRRIDAILAVEVAWGKRERIMRRLKDEAVVVTERV